MILMYHKVGYHPKTMWWISVDAFNRQMADLQAYQVVYLDEYDPKNPHHVVITFDGPYENVLTVAGPILARWGYPFELFVVGDWLGCYNDFDLAEPAARFASLDQLKELKRLGGRLQWHTRSHVRLNSEEKDCLERELTVPDRLREEFSAPHFTWFSYPHGLLDSVIEEYVAKYFCGAVACESDADDSRFRLSRLAVVESTRFSVSTVAVIIPNYNYGCFVGEAIESVLSQTIMPDEIIVIDDGSTDSSLDIISTYAEDVTVLVNETNVGIVETFRKAVAATKSDYIVFVGADNRIRCDYIERCRAALDADSSVAVAYTDVVLFGPRAQWHAERVKKASEFKVDEVFNDSATGEKMYVWCFPEPTPEVVGNIHQTNFIHGSSMYRRKAYEQVGGYRRVYIAEDKDLFQRMLALEWKCVHVPYALLEYRQHAVTQSNVALGLEQALMMQISQVKKLKQRIAELQSVCSEAHNKLGTVLQKPQE